jgi:hypothetical protein
MTQTLMDSILLPEKFRDKRVHEYVLALTDFLTTHSWIYDFKLTRFFRDRVCHRLPDEWKQTLISLTSSELNELPFGFVKEEWPDSLKEFISEAMSLDLPERTVTRKLTGKETKSVTLSGKIATGMSPKKTHEVERMVAFVRQLCEEHGIRHLVDVGAGLGYVSQAISSELGIDVIGLESVEMRCHAANQRQEKLVKSGGSETVMKMINFAVKDTEESEREFCRILRQFCGSEDEGLNPVCLLGLHCCGDLTPLTIKLFHKCCPPQSTLVCLGCCYHRMSGNSDGFCYFPLSASVKSVVYGKKKKDPNWKLSVFGLRLAAQETRSRWREQSALEHDLHMKRVAYRAVVETALKSDSVRLRKVVKNDKCATFESYLMAALNHMISNKEEYDKYKKMCTIAYSQFEPDFLLVEPFTALQTLLQPLLESLIITDQVTYLAEMGISATIVTMFEDFISPRNLAVVAVKSYTSEQSD